MSDWPEALEKIRGTVGVWTMAQDSLAPERSAEMAGELEALGYAALWFPEAWGREAFTSASLLLSGTTSLVIATGIANIWGRDAVTAANGAKTLTAAYDGRFVLGLGVSHEPLVQRLRGHDYRAPLATMHAQTRGRDE